MGGIHGPAAGEAGDHVDSGIGAEHGDIFEELLAHGLEGDSLIAHGQSGDASGILQGEEALGHDDIEINIEAERGESDDQDQELVLQDPAQSAGVAGVDGFESCVR